MDLRGAIELHRPLTAAEMRPGLLVSAVADDELGDGRLRYRTQKVIGYRRDGSPIYQVKGSSLQTWQETLVTAQVDGTALNTSTSAVSIIPAAARFTLPANYFSVIGKDMRVTAKGRVSTFTSGTLTLTDNMGPTSNLIMFTSGALVMIPSLTNKTFELVIDLTCRAIGSSTSANLFGTGRLTSSAIGTSAVGAAANCLMLPDATPVVGAGFDSTVAMVQDLIATWSVSSASNSIQVHQYRVEALN